MSRTVALVAVVLLLLGCRISPGVSSADAPTSAVPFSWSLNDSPHPDGHRLRFYGGTLHSIPSQVRLVGPSGQVITTAAAIFSPSSGALCGVSQAVGTASVELPLPAAEVANFRRGWPAGYRVESEVGGVWQSTTLTHAGCTTTE